MTDMSDNNTPMGEDGQVPLDLVPSFAEDDGHGKESWAPLTTANAEYERLWSVPNGSSTVPANEDELTEVPPEADGTPPPIGVASPEPTPGFTGTLVTGSEVMNASIVVGSERIMLWGGGTQIGNWLHSQARVARLTHARFAIQAEGETLTFTAEDPTALDNAIAVAAKPGESTSNQAATPHDLPPTVEAVASPPHEPAPNPRRLSTRPAPAPDPTPGDPVDIPQSGDPDPAPAAAARRPRIKNFRPEPTDAPPPAAPIPPDTGFPYEPPPATTDPEDEVTIADTVRAHSAPKRVKPRRFLPSDTRGIAIKGIVVLGLVGFLAGVAYAVMLLMGRVGGEGGTAAAPTESTAPPITIVITTTPPATAVTTAVTTLPDTTFFQTDPAVLTERWNSLAEVTAPNMVLFSDLASPFILLLTPNVTMEGVLDPAVGNVTLRATPTGTPEGDGAILSALGILIGTADPTLDGADRKALLGQLGLDVDRPELGGINGSLTYNGLFYRMVYQAEANSLEFVITPEGATSTTAAG